MSNIKQHIQYLGVFLFALCAVLLLLPRTAYQQPASAISVTWDQAELVDTPGVVPYYYMQGSINIDSTYANLGNLELRFGPTNDPTFHLVRAYGPGNGNNVTMAEEVQRQDTTLDPGVEYVSGVYNGGTLISEVALGVYPGTPNAPATTTNNLANNVPLAITGMGTQTITEDSATVVVSYTAPTEVELRLYQSVGSNPAIMLVPGSQQELSPAGPDSEEFQFTITGLTEGEEYYINAVIEDFTTNSSDQGDGVTFIPEAVPQSNNNQNNNNATSTNNTGNQNNNQGNNPGNTGNNNNSGSNSFDFSWNPIDLLGSGSLNIPISSCSGGDNCYTLLEQLPGFPAEISGDINLGEYINAIFVLFVGIISLLSVIMIIIGGFQLMSYDSVAGKTTAKETIRNAVLGLLLALGTFIILNTINPQLLNLGIGSS